MTQPATPCTDLEIVLFIENISYMTCSQSPEHFVQMQVFAKNLRKRAEELGLSNAEIAWRLDLSERRYAHYVAGRNEPDLGLLIKIAKILETTPDILIRFDAKSIEPSKRTVLYDRLLASAKLLKDGDLEALAVQAEAVVALRKK